LSSIATTASRMTSGIFFEATTTRSSAAWSDVMIVPSAANMKDVCGSAGALARSSSRSGRVQAAATSDIVTNATTSDRIG